MGLGLRGKRTGIFRAPYVVVFNERVAESGENIKPAVVLTSVGSPLTRYWLEGSLWNWGCLVRDKQEI